MTTYEEIIMLIKLGKTPIVKDVDWWYCACIYQKDGIIFATDLNEDIRNVFDGSWDERDEEDIEEHKREIVRVDTPERHIFKEWDLIDLDIEALEKIEGWENIKVYFWDGKWLVIESVSNAMSWLYYSIKIKNWRNQFLWAGYILPHKVEKEVQKMTVKEICNKLWYEVEIVK